MTAAAAATTTAWWRYSSAQASNATQAGWSVSSAGWKSSLQGGSVAALGTTEDLGASVVASSSVVTMSGVGAGQSAPHTFLSISSAVQSSSLPYGSSANFTESSSTHSRSTQSFSELVTASEGTSSTASKGSSISSVLLSNSSSLLHFSSIKSVVSGTRTSWAQAYAVEILTSPVSTAPPSTESTSGHTLLNNFSSIVVPHSALSAVSAQAAAVQQAISARGTSNGQTQRTESIPANLPLSSSTVHISDNAGVGILSNFRSKKSSSAVSIEMQFSSTSTTWATSRRLFIGNSTPGTNNVSLNLVNQSSYTNVSNVQATSIGSLQSTELPLSKSDGSRSSSPQEMKLTSTPQNMIEGSNTTFHQEKLMSLSSGSFTSVGEIISPTAPVERYAESTETYTQFSSLPFSQASIALQSSFELFSTSVPKISSLDGLSSLGLVRILLATIVLGNPSFAISSSFCLPQPFDNIKIVVPAGSWGQKTVRSIYSEALTASVFDLQETVNNSLPGISCGPGVALGPLNTILSGPIYVSIPCNMSLAPSSYHLAAFAYTGNSTTPGMWSKEAVVMNIFNTSGVAWAQFQYLSAYSLFWISNPLNRGVDLSVLLGSIFGSILVFVVAGIFFLLFLNKQNRAGHSLSSRQKLHTVSPAVVLTNRHIGSPYSEKYTKSSAASESRVMQLRSLWSPPETDLEISCVPVSNKLLPPILNRNRNLPLANPDSNCGSAARKLRELCSQFVGLPTIFNSTLSQEEMDVCSQHIASADNKSQVAVLHYNSLHSGVLSNDEIKHCSEDIEFGISKQDSGYIKEQVFVHDSLFSRHLSPEEVVTCCDGSYLSKDEATLCKDDFLACCVLGSDEIDNCQARTSLKPSKWLMNPDNIRQGTGVSMAEYAEQKYILQRINFQARSCTAEGSDKYFTATVPKANRSIAVSESLCLDDSISTVPKEISFHGIEISVSDHLNLQFSTLSPEETLFCEENMHKLQNHDLFELAKELSESQTAQLSLQNTALLQAENNLLVLPGLSKDPSSCAMVYKANLNPHSAKEESCSLPSSVETHLIHEIDTDHHTVYPVSVLTAIKNAHEPMIFDHRLDQVIAPLVPYSLHNYSLHTSKYKNSLSPDEIKLCFENSFDSKISTVHLSREYSEPWSKLLAPEEISFFGSGSSGLQCQTLALEY